MKDTPWAGTCQHCGEEFDWREEECPHCGWDKRAWIGDGRYGPMREARP